MTNLEKALIEKIQEIEAANEERKQCSKDMLNQVVWYSNAASSVEDFLYMSGKKGSRFICMNHVSEETMPDEFARIYEYFKYILEDDKQAEQKEAT